jgi:trans-aconitate methyltransferase
LSEDWLALAEHVAETLDIGPGTRVFEVDCGDGAFLSPLHANGYVVGGIDGDADAINRAIETMPGGVFHVGTATSLDPAVPWDVVVCRTFSGARDVDYLRGVVARMFAKSTHAVALLDLPDQHRQWALHALAEAGAAAIQFEQAGGDRPLVHVFARSTR